MYQLSENEINFNMLYAISKDYRWAVPPILIQDIIHKNYTNQKVIFEFTDGENFLISGAKEFLKETQRIFNIPKERLVIRSHNKLDLEWATCENYPSNGFLQMATQYMAPIDNQKFNKKFLSMQGRMELFRLRVIKHLHTHYKDDSIISFQPTLDVVKFYFDRSPNTYKEEIVWAEKYAPLNSDNVVSCYRSGSTSAQESIQQILKYYDQYFIEVALETDYKNPFWITEKTARSLALGKPFILFSGPLALEYLRSLGFKTFSHWIDESYDKIENPIDRFNAVVREIDKLSILSYNQLKIIATEMYDVLAYNQQHLTTFG